MEPAEHILWYQPLAVQKRTPPAITRTSRKIRYDALKLYYQNNEFEANVCHMGDPTGSTYDMPVMRWLTAIGAKNRGYIRSLQIFDKAGGGDPGNICFQHWNKASRDMGAEPVPVDGTVSRYGIVFPKVADIESA